MSVYDSLPVAPEFVLSLEEIVTQTAVECLETLNVPRPVIRLVQAISELNYYLVACYQHPEDLQGPASNRFGIEAVVIESINAVAQCGGSFGGAKTTTEPRPVKFLAMRTRKRPVEMARGGGQ